MSAATDALAQVATALVAEDSRRAAKISDLLDEAADHCGRPDCTIDQLVYSIGDALAAASLCFGCGANPSTATGMCTPCDKALDASPAELSR